MQFFIDTNILIDVLTGRDGSNASKRLFALAHLGRVDLFVSALSYVNAVYICKRYGMSVEAVLQSLKAIASFVHVNDLSANNVISCLSKGWKDYEDSTQAFCAAEHGASCVVTRNTKDFSESSLLIMTPEEALEQINNKTEY